MKIVLSVPGTEERYGTFVEELGFDDMVKVQITSYYDDGKVKQLNANQIYYYLAHRKDVKEIK